MPILKLKLTMVGKNIENGCFDLQSLEKEYKKVLILSLEKYVENTLPGKNVENALPGKKIDTKEVESALLGGKCLKSTCAGQIHN